MTDPYSHETPDRDYSLPDPNDPPNNSCDYRHYLPEYRKQAEAPHQDTGIADLIAPELPTASEPQADTTVKTRKRGNGWTVERQKLFLEALAEHGCVSHAAEEVGLSASSAYRFRLKPQGKAFADAWERALDLATVRLTDIAMERAVNGVVEEVVSPDGEVTTRRRHSDRLLMFLLQNLRPHTFGTVTGYSNDYVKSAREALPKLTRQLRAEKL
ncbi:MAG: hypothetical protein AAGH53_05410 [Pseudomonadota bacterium]